LGVLLKLLAWLVFGSIAATLVGTLASVCAVSGYSQIDLPATSNAFLVAAGLASLLCLAVSLLAWRPMAAVGRIFVLNAAAAVAYPIASFAVPLIARHPLLGDTTLASAAAVAPLAAAPIINAILGSGMFGVIGIALTALFLLLAVILLRGAGHRDDY
jgi:multisubunit Na+/H+ antiporter MnhC subunit